eukprot:1353323-Lingulodinium_polyedra.AAC.1
MAQWHTLREEKVLALHGREELDTTTEEHPAKAKVPKATFSPTNQPPSIQTDSLLQPATWPVFSAQSSQVLGAELQLLRHCLQHDCWEVAED